MAENSAGSLIFTIGGDASGMLDAARSVQSASNNMVSSLDRTASAAKKTWSAFGSLGNEAVKLVQVLSNNTSVLNTRMTATAQAVQQATSGMSRGGYVAQQFGYQMQDAVIQLQMGTSLFRVIAQQAPQFLGALGPMGATAGLAVALAAALGGALYSGFNNAKSSAEQLELAMKDLKEIITTSGGDVDVLTQKIAKLAQQNQTLAQIKLAQGMLEAQDAIKAAKGTIDEASSSFEGLFSTLQGGSISDAVLELQRLDSAGLSLSDAISSNLNPAVSNAAPSIDSLQIVAAKLSGKLGITTEQSLDFIRAIGRLNADPSAASMEKLAATVEGVRVSQANASPDLIKFAALIADAAISAGDATNKLDALKNAAKNIKNAIAQSNLELDGQAAAIKKIVANAQFEAKVAETVGTNIKQQDRIRAIASVNASKLSEQDKKINIDAINGAFDKIEAQKAAVDAAHKSEAATKKDTTAQQQNAQRLEDSASKAKQLELELSNLRNGTDEGAAATSRYTIETAKLEAQRQLGATATQSQIDAEAGYILRIHQATDAIAALKKKQAEDTQTTQSFETVEKRAGTKGQNVEDQYKEDLKALENYHKMAGASNSRYEKTKSRLEEKYRKDKQAAAIEDYKAQSEWNTFLMDGLDALGQSATTTIAGLASGTMTATEAMQNFANIILNQAVGALVSMGIEALKNQIVGQTAAAASVATATATGTAISAAYATPAFLANVATMGGASATGLASLQAGVASSQMLAVAGARQFGGSVNAGSAYRIGENGSAEVLTQDGRNYLLPGDSGGQVSPLNGIGGGGFSQQVNITNSAGANVSTNSSADGKQLNVMIDQRVSQSIRKKQGMIARAFRGSTNTSWRAH